MDEKLRLPYQLQCGKVRVRERELKKLQKQATAAAAAATAAAAARKEKAVTSPIKSTTPNPTNDGYPIMNVPTPYNIFFQQKRQEMEAIVPALKVGEITRRICKYFLILRIDSLPYLCSSRS